MADDGLSLSVRALLARAPGAGGGVSDSVSALLARAPRPASNPAPTNYHPRDQSDVDLGIESGPIVADPNNWQDRFTGTGTQLPGGPNERAVQAPPQRPPSEMEGDPLAQQVVAGVLGGAAGKLVGPIASRLGPVLGRAAVGATEGAVASKTAGGSAAAGALLGGGLGALGGVVKGAAGRVRARASSIEDAVQGEGEAAKASKPLARRLEQRAGDEGDNLASELDKDPGLERQLSVTVKRYPKKAAEALNAAIDRHDAAIAPEYKAITDAGGVKLTSVVSPLQKLKDGYLAAGKTEEASAVQREIDSLAENYGGKEAENAVLTGEQLRGIKKSIGKAAFPPTVAAANAVKAQVKRGLYGAYRGAIEDAVGTLEGVAPVNLARFRAHNQAMSQLLPLRDVVEDRAAGEATGAKSIVGRLMEFAGGEGAKPGALPLLALRHGFTPEALKEALIEYAATKVLPAAGRAAAQAGRHIDVGLSRIAPLGVESAEGIPEAAGEFVGARAKDAATDAITPEDAARAGATGSAAREAPGVRGLGRLINGVRGLGRLINGVRIFGRPATAAERTAAGLPAALDHAITTGNPTLGHAALANEVLGQ